MGIVYSSTLRACDGLLGAPVSSDFTKSEDCRKKCLSLETDGD